MMNLELVSTIELLAELNARNDKLVVITECKKIANSVDVFIKTPFGPLAKVDKGYDLIYAIDILHAASSKLISKYLEKNPENGSGGD